MKKGIVAGILALSLLLGGAAIFAVLWRRQESGAREPDEGAAQECVAIRVGQSGSDALAASGSGVVFEKSEDALWVVTAGHVLERADAEHPVYVVFPKGCDSVSGTDKCSLAGEVVTVQCTDYDVLAEADLAFLRLGCDELPKETWQGLRAAERDKESYDALQSMDKVYVSGCWDGSLVVCEGTLEEFWIYVEDFGQYMTLARCELSHGMSGGGLYDEEGRLIGIVCGSNEQGEVAAVPLHVVEARFEADSSARAIR